MAALDIGRRGKQFVVAMRIVSNLVLKLAPSFLLAAAAARPLGAQELRGLVTDSASRQPIPGAVLVLLDANGATLGRNITNQRGQYRIAATTAMRRMRVLRIGFRPREVALPPLTTGIVEVNVVMTALPTLLETVRVSSGAPCPKRSDRLIALSLLEQARAGLLATIVAREIQPAEMIRLRYTRYMIDNSDRIEHQRVWIDSATGVKTSFVAVRPAADFVKYGFSLDTNNVQRFFGPDAETLLDDAFRDGYCFHLRDPERNRPHQVGLAFVAAKSERGRVDVDGTLWIDTAARQLRDIRFDYVGLDRRLMNARPGGRIEFRELPNSVVLIDRWFFRIPAVRQDTVWTDADGRASAPDPSHTAIPVLRPHYYAQESGGELATARWPDGFVWNASLGAARIQAVDKKGAPLAGREIYLDETDYRGVSNATGEIAIDRLLPGPYSVRAIDPVLGALGITLKTTLKFTAARDSVIRATAQIPSMVDYVREECERVRGFKADSTALWFVLRVVRPDAEPAAAAEWHAWRRGAADWRGIADAGGFASSDGLLYYCGGALHNGDTVKVEARGARREPWTSTEFIVRDQVTPKILKLPFPPKTP